MIVGPSLLHDLYVRQLKAYRQRPFTECASRIEDLHTEIARLERATVFRLAALQRAASRQRMGRRMAVIRRRLEPLSKSVEHDGALPSARRRGWVYVLRTYSGLYKIGKARNLKNRLSGLAILGKDTFECIHTIKCEDHHWAERELHDHFRAQRIERELFSLTDEQVAWLCSIAALNASGAVFITGE
jgi:hypothetical protein